MKSKSSKNCFVGYSVKILILAVSSLEMFFTSLRTRIIELSSHWVFQEKPIIKLKVSNRNTRVRYEICSKLTIKTPEQYQLTSLRCLYYKLYTYFTTSLVIVLLTYYLPFVKRYIEKQQCEIVPKSSCSADSMKDVQRINFAFVKNLRRSSVVV